MEKNKDLPPLPESNDNSNQQAANNQSEQKQGPFSTLQLATLRGKGQNSNNEQAANPQQWNYQKPSQNLDAPQAQPKQMTETADEEEKQGKGCRPGCKPNCTTCSCGCFLIAVALIACIAFLFIYRPPQILEPIRGWLNQDLQALNYQQQTQEQISIDIQNQVLDFELGENELIITETQLNSLVSMESNIPETYIDSKSGYLKAYTDIDSSDERLWLVAEIELDNQQVPYIASAGTEGLRLPQALNKVITDSIFSVLELSGNTAADQFVSRALNLPSNVDVKDIQFEERQVVLKLEVNSGLENWFN